MAIPQVPTYFEAHITDTWLIPCELGQCDDHGLIHLITVPNQTDTNQNSTKYELKNDRKRFDFRYPYSIFLLYFFRPRAISLFAYSSANG